MRVRDRKHKAIWTLLMLVGLAAGFLGCSGVSEENRVRSEREYELAVSQYRGEGNSSAALISLERSLQANPSNADARLLLGTIYGSAELYDQAEPHLRRAVEILERLSRDDPGRLGDLAVARNTLAATLINLGRSNDAVVFLQLVVGDVHFQPQHLALANLGAAYTALGRSQDAVRVLEQAVERRNEFCVGFYRLGDAYFHLDDYQKADEALSRAVENPAPGCDRIQPAWRIRGEVRSRLRQIDGARADFTRCRDLDSRSRDGQACASSLAAMGAP